MLLTCPHCQKRNRVPDERLADHPTCGACGKALWSGVMAVDSQDLNTLANQQALPVIIDFWAPWCGPCRQFAPAFAAAAQQYGGRLIFAKLDTEANESAAVSYQIRSIPTLIVLRNGREVQRVSGALPASQLDKFIQEVL